MRLRFLKYSRKYSQRDLPTHEVRMLSPWGAYPAKSLLNELGSLVIGEGLCFSVVPFSATIEANENYYSEVEWISLNEIRLYASILLATDRENDFFSIYPVGRPYRIQTDQPLTSKRLLRAIRTQLIVRALFPIFGSTSGKEISTIVLDAREIALPPIFGGPPYRSSVRSKRLKLQEKLLNNIDVKDYLLIRGLSTLLRCGMISRHSQFLEESINTLFISLEASFRLIIRILENRGEKNVTSGSAAAYIARPFNHKPREKYFEEYYESRIMSMHPESRYGIFPHAPLWVDDCYDLRDALQEVYAYLVAGYVDPKYKELFGTTK